MQLQAKFSVNLFGFRNMNRHGYDGIFCENHMSKAFSSEKEFVNEHLQFKKWPYSILLILGF